MMAVNITLRQWKMLFIHRVNRRMVGIRNVIVANVIVNVIVGISNVIVTI